MEDILFTEKQIETKRKRQTIIDLYEKQKRNYNGKVPYGTIKAISEHLEVKGGYVRMVIDKYNHERKINAQTGSNN